MAKGQGTDKAWPSLLGGMCDTYGLLSLGLGHHVVGLRHLHCLGRHFDLIWWLDLVRKKM